MVATLTRRSVPTALKPPYDGLGPPGETRRPEGSTVPHATRAGDVLADRYRLVDLLSESGGGRFWRAHDRILERHVALHVIAADDPRAELLLDAARRSATVLDPRILRVLDAERTGDCCFVVNEWGSGTSLDIMLASNGPLSPRRGAWMVSEVADSIAAAHAHGVAHGLLSPENVLLDNNGSVRIIGFCVDAALHGLPPGDPQRRRGRPGRSPARDPDRPLGRGLAIRRAACAREARPGAPAPAGAGRRTQRPGRPVRRAAQPARPAARGRPRPRQRARHPELPGRLRGRPVRAGPGDSGGQPGEERDRRAPRRARDPGPAAPGRLGAAGRARGAGRPNQSPNRSRSRTPSSRPPPRPGCRSSTTRTTRSPGCAPATSRRPRHRRSRSHRSARCSPRRPASLATRARTPGRWWPAVTSTGPSTTSARAAAVSRPWTSSPTPASRCRAATGCGWRCWSRWCWCCSWRWRSRSTSAAARPRWAPSPTTSPAPRARRRSPRPFPRRRRSRICRPPTSTPRGTARRTPTRPLVPSTATRTTAWTTLTYKQQLGPGGLKRGVGLLVDLGQSRAVRRVELTLVGQPTDALALPVRRRAGQPRAADPGRRGAGEQRRGERRPRGRAHRALPHGLVHVPPGCPRRLQGWDR